MFYLIGFYGSRNRKIHAAYQFFLYTLLGSLLLLFALIGLSLNAGSSNYLVI
jgi:proton-translocating NADH-quinone oxidoreductase chain M